jgi:mannose-6-phosphate isomerase-like protein (cupin superfamily)
VVFQGFYEKEAPSGNRCLVSGNGTRIEVMLDADGVGSDQMEMAEITFPGTLNPTAGHRHGSTEVLYVLEGEIDHGIDGTFQRLGPGMVGVVRPGQEVVHRPRGSRPVRVLAVWTPGGEIGRIAPAFQPCSGGS